MQARATAELHRPGRVRSTLLTALQGAQRTLRWIHVTTQRVSLAALALSERLMPRDHLVPLSLAQRVLGFARFAFERFLSARSLQVAGSLTYTTLLALVPLLTVALTVLTAFSGFRLLLARVREFLLGQLLPETANRIVANYVSHFSANASQLRLAGTLVLFVAALSAMLTVERAFSDIWNVRARRPLFTRLFTYLLLILLGPLLVGIALTLSTTLFKAGLGLTHVLPWLPRTLLNITPALAIITLLSGAYQWLPYRHVATRHALAGGLLGGLGFELMRWLFSFYVHHFAAYTVVYGAFAAVPIFLLWIYLSWAVVLGGAVLTASLSHWRGDAWRIPREHPDQRFRDAVQVLRVLMAAGKHSLGLRDLQRRVYMGYEDLEVALELLAGAGLVLQPAHDAWQGTAKAWQSTVGDVWVLFHRGPRPGEHWCRDGELAEISTLLDAIPRVDLAIPMARLVKPVE